MLVTLRCNANNHPSLQDVWRAYRRVVPGSHPKLECCRARLEGPRGMFELGEVNSQALAPMEPGVIVFFIEEDEDEEPSIRDLLVSEYVPPSEPWLIHPLATQQGVPRE